MNRAPTLRPLRSLRLIHPNLDLGAVATAPYFVTLVPFVVNFLLRIGCG